MTAPGSPAGERIRDRNGKLAMLCEYPRAGYRGAAAAVPDFAAAISAFTDTDLEELYVRTFEMNPDCALEIGWHIFGEQYERGEFLVTMRAELRKHSIAETTELPDHLSQVLRLLARVSEDEAADLAGKFAVPALDKILGKLESGGNPFEHLLRAARREVEALAAARRTA